MDEYNSEFSDDQLTVKLRMADSNIFMWNTHNLPNGSVGAIGSFLEDVTGSEQHVSHTVQANIDKHVTCNRHLVFDVRTLTTAGTFRVSGYKVDEADGSVSPHNEEIAIDAIGYYQTDAKWMGDVSVIATDMGDIRTHFNSLTYYDASNFDYAITFARGSWTPGHDSWSCRIKILKVMNSGEVVDLSPQWDFSSSDSMPRAYKGVQGNCKVAISEVFLGSKKEGLILLIDNILNIKQGGVTLQVKGVDPDTGGPFAYGL